MKRPRNVTTQAAVDVYTASTPVFEGLIREVRELSRKKPEATMSAGKVKLINRVLDDVLGILREEPAGKYLAVLDDETLPQVSDAVLMMVQFETALKAFEARYRRYLDRNWGTHWITEEFVASHEDEFEGEEDVD